MLSLSAGVCYWQKYPRKLEKATYITSLLGNDQTPNCLGETELPPKGRMRFPFIQRHHGCQAVLSWGRADPHQPEQNVSGVTESLGTVWIPPPALRWKSAPFSLFHRTLRHRNAFSSPRGLAQGAERVSIFVCLSGFLSLLPDKQKERTDEEG